jgi:hypothetical protein
MVTAPSAGAAEIRTAAAAAARTFRIFMVLLPLVLDLPIREAFAAVRKPPTGQRRGYDEWSLILRWSSMRVARWPLASRGSVCGAAPRTALNKRLRSLGLQVAESSPVQRRDGPNLEDTHGGVTRITIRRIGGDCRVSPRPKYEMPYQSAEFVVCGLFRRELELRASTRAAQVWARPTRCRPGPRDVVVDP